MKKIIFIIVLISQIGCAKFSPGSCVQNVNDGFIWRITEVGIKGYKIQGWFDGKWGLVVDASFSILDECVKITCPFSTKIVQ